MSRPDVRWLWPIERLHEGMTSLLGLAAGHPVAPLSPPDDDAVRWLERSAWQAGFQVSEVEMQPGEIRRWLARSGVAIVSTRGGFLLLLDGATAPLALGLDGSPARIPLEDAMALVLARTTEEDPEALLAALGVGQTRERAARWLAAEEREGERGAARGGIWLLRPAASPSLLSRLGRRRIPGRLSLVLGLGLLQSALGGAVWLGFGASSLAGTLDAGRFHALSLGLMGGVVLQCLLSLWFADIALAVAIELRTELFRGALRLPADSVRGAGVGAMLGRVNEASAFDGLLLSGGLGLLGVVGDLFVALGLFRASPLPAVGLGLFAGLLALVLALGWFTMERSVGHALERVRMSNELIENIVGHRTRLAQQAPSRWHLREETLVRGYLDSARAVEEGTLALGILPRLAVVLGVAGLLPLMLAMTPSSSGELLLGLAAVAAASGALARVAGLFQLLASLRVVGQSAWPLLRAAAVAGPPAVGPMLPQRRPLPGETLLAASDLRFGYATRGEQILGGLSLQIHAGERLLLQGPSGSGKSTLAAILAGLRAPSGGALLVRGIDHHSLPAEEWRRVVAVAPQFHENHVFSASFAFNLLLARRWPPSSGDLEEATRLCRELGLGPLLERMPGGLHQHIGETGWQLSHGERSRLFLARALLQDPDMVIFDESFASLDPATLEQVLQTVLARSRTLLVIAHPLPQNLLRGRGTLAAHAAVAAVSSPSSGSRKRRRCSPIATQSRSPSSARATVCSLTRVPFFEPRSSM